MQTQSNDVVASHGRFVKNNDIAITNGEQETKPTSFFLAPVETRKSTINLNKAIEYELKHGRKLDPRMDQKKLRRTVSNRLSAQRSRLKKAKHIDEMEKKVAELEQTIIVLNVRVERMKENKKLLQLQNEALERILVIRMDEANHHQMILENNQAELSRLKEVEKDLMRQGEEAMNMFINF